MSATELKKEINELLDELRKHPRKDWLGSPIQPDQDAGRCAGSYGCGMVVPDDEYDAPKPDKDSDSIEEFFSELSLLLNAGVRIGNAIAALGRKYADVKVVQELCKPLIAVLKDAKATTNDFLRALEKGLAGVDKKTAARVIEAAKKGKLDTL